MLKFLTLAYLSLFHVMFAPEDIRLDLDKIFIHWNEATLQSLERQQATSLNDKQKSNYNNRILGFKWLMRLEDAKTLDKESIRYRFLQLIQPQIEKREVVIVEANYNGSTQVLRNFLVYKGDNDTSVVELYLFLKEGGWYKKGTAKTQVLQFDMPLSKYLTNYGKGFTYEDVIISHFSNGKNKVITSEYYLFTTLSADSGVKKLLDMHEKTGEFNN